MSAHASLSSRFESFATRRTDCITTVRFCIRQEYMEVRSSWARLSDEEAKAPEEQMPRALQIVPPGQVNSDSRGAGHPDGRSSRAVSVTQRQSMDVPVSACAQVAIPWGHVKLVD